MISEKGDYAKYHHDGLEGINSSTNPPTARTGAPGENTCTQCHIGPTFSAAGVVTYDFSDLNDEYYPDSTYTISLGIAGGSKNGFEMTILDDNDEQAGTFTAGTGSAVAIGNSREYIRHSASVGVNDWTFSWTAPSTDLGNLTAYFAFNKSNNAGTTGSDSIFIGQETILVSPSAALTDYQQLQNDFHAFYDGQNAEIVINYQTLKQSKIVINVQDLSGRLLYKEDLGNKNTSKQTERIQLNHMNQSGLVIVSVFVDNYVLNQKLFIH